MCVLLHVVSGRKRIVGLIVGPPKIGGYGSEGPTPSLATRFVRRVRLVRRGWFENRRDIVNVFLNVICVFAFKIIVITDTFGIESRPQSFGRFSFPKF